jgi:hypothetical protein
MRFIRKNGRVIPIKETRDNSDSLAGRSYRSAAKQSVASGAIAAAGVHIAKAAAITGNKPLAIGASIATAVFSIGSDIRRMKQAVKIKKESNGKFGALVTYLDLNLNHLGGSALAGFGLRRAMGPTIKGIFSAQKVAAKGMGAALKFSEKVADNRRFKNAKRVFAPISGFLYKGK